jgi:hypothetical protein
MLLGLARTRQFSVASNVGVQWYVQQDPAFVSPHSGDTMQLLSQIWRVVSRNFRSSMCNKNVFVCFVCLRVCVSYWNVHLHSELDHNRAALMGYNGFILIKNIKEERKNVSSDKIYTCIVLLLLLLLDGTAQRDPYTVTISGLLFNSIWVIIIPHLSTRALWKLTAETSGSKARETWWQMASVFCLRSLFHTVGYFNMR